AGGVIARADVGVFTGGPGGAAAGAEAAAAADAALAAAYLAFCAGLLNGKGACFGMVLTSIQMQNNPGLINATNGLPSGASATVFNLQAGGSGPASQALRWTIEKNHLAQFSAEMAHYAGGWAADSVLGRHSAPAIYDQIASLLQSGQHPIISLRGGANHAVVAYDLEGDRNGVYYIDVYDPNRPFAPGGDGTRATDSRIKMDPARGWS